MTLGNCSVAVPVLDPGGEVVAALGIVAPSVRADPPKLVKPLLPAAEAIRRKWAEHESTASDVG